VRARCTVARDSFLGVPARGRRQVLTATTQYFVDSRIDRTFRTADDLERLLQLGATVRAGRQLNAPWHAGSRLAAFRTSGPTSAMVSGMAAVASFSMASTADWRSLVVFDLRSWMVWAPRP
jgi:hypothetical protein